MSVNIECNWCGDEWLEDKIILKSCWECGTDNICKECAHECWCGEDIYCNECITHCYECIQEVCPTCRKDRPGKPGDYLCENCDMK